MKLENLIWLLALVLVGCGMFQGMKPDSLAEEIVEDVIAAETGVQLDLSPSSPEN
jgi:hypothetical protein